MRIDPSYSEFEELARNANVIPVSSEILADLETPVTAFLKIRRSPHAFLLESVQGGETWGRYTFLGTDPAWVWTARRGEVEIRSRDGRVERRREAKPFEALRERMGAFRTVDTPGLPRFMGGAVGFLGWDVVREFERLPRRAVDDLDLPEAVLLLADRLIVFDNVTQRVRVVANAILEEGTSLRQAYDGAVQTIEEWLGRLRSPLPIEVGGDDSAAGPLEVRSNRTPAEYQAMVRAAKEYVHAGDVIQVVLAQRFETELRVDPFQIYRSLRSINPSPYLFFLELGDQTLAGASPEVMVRVEDREITVRPIAGTRPRGATPIADHELEGALLADPKEIAEHIMLVDLGRNDIGRVAEIGSVEVTERQAVERYSHVMHMVSNVRGKLAPGCDAFDGFRATFPAGTLSGAPKIRAMEIIDELEPARRGVYGGAVGYFGFSGNMDTGIAIRTVLVKGGKVYVQAGAGIVADSVPEREHAECLSKAQGMVQALQMAETI